jgi:ATP-dependent Lon protease
MTGEITLSGLVLPVGGIREKALAARRHGVRVLILPQQNLQDTEELPDEVKQELKFVPVGTLDEALAISLPAPAETRGA